MTYKELYKRLNNNMSKDIAIYINKISYHVNSIRKNGLNDNMSRDIIIYIDNVPYYVNGAKNNGLNAIPYDM